MSMYILDDKGNVKKESDPIKWAAFLEPFEKRQVALSHIDKIRVSTVFLTMDHNFSGTGEPILWETMAFFGDNGDNGDDDDDYTRRYTSKEDALIGHSEVVKQIEELNFSQVK